MSKTNCVNCGAAIEMSESKCPFCGTSYFDFTNINVGSRTPTIVRMRYDGKIITFKAITSQCDAEMSTDRETVYTDNCPWYYVFQPKLHLTVEFDAIPNTDGELFHIEKED